MHVESTFSLRVILLSLALFLVVISAAIADAISLDQAISIAVNKTSRGEMIRGNLDVAEQTYFARRINFYLPEISINGSVPAYSVDESYRFFGSSGTKGLFKTRDLGLRSFIELNQSLFTGGDVTVTANLRSQDERYPYTGGDSLRFGSFINEKSRLGDFIFSFSQPILKPSASRNEYQNSRDDFSIAQLTMIEDETALAKEVTEVYLALAQQQIKCEIFTDRFESASLAAEIDSMKLLDGVASEEDWLLSASNRLDAQLALFDAENSLSEMKRQFAILLDRDPETEFTLHVPPVGDHIDSLEREQMLQTWDRSLPVAKAELEYTKADRAAEHAASGHGLNGDLNVDYSTGQGQVTTQGLEEKIVTRGWSVSLDFTFPLWDGGASKAAVKSAKIAAEQAKLDLSTSKRTTKAEIINLINKLDVSYKRLGIIRQQVDLAQNKLDIAESRYNDGQISRITYLDSEIFYLETRDTYLEELKNYLLDRKELEGKFRNA